MLDFLSKRAEALIDSLLEPAWQRLLGMSWLRRLGVVILLGLILFAVRNWEDALFYAQRGQILVRVALSEPQFIPIGDAAMRTSRETARRIETTLLPELAFAGRPGLEPWPVAQAVAAATRIDSIDTRRVLEFLRSSSDPSCGCWRQIPGTTHPENVAVSGWVAFAMARLDGGLSEQSVEFFLTEQSPGGWWSVFPSEAIDDHASVYATAWAVLGLRAQLEKHLIDPSLQASVEAAVTRAQAWIQSSRLPGSARWKPYPGVGSPPAFLATSGLALHALHRIDPEGIGSVDSLWLDGLPSPPPDLSASEVPAVWVNARDGRFEDSLIQLTYPWVLIATMDAYAHGTLLQRTGAVAWLEQALSDASLRDADTQLPNWWRAELLLALNYLLNRVHVASGER